MIHDPQFLYHSGAHNHHMHAHYHSGFCHSCCHPISQCCCHVKGCRKEAKEVTYTNVESAANNGTLTLLDSEAATLGSSAGNIAAERTIATNDLTPLADGTRIITRNGDFEFIGGGCCAHLSVEYMPANYSANSVSTVNVKVQDSEGTSLQWVKSITSDTPYSINEDIITTYPGAKLYVSGSNIIARVRWCEVFSC